MPTTGEVDSLKACGKDFPLLSPFILRDFCRTSGPRFLRSRPGGHARQHAVERAAAEPPPTGAQAWEPR